MLVWLCRDPDAPIGGELRRGRVEHKLFSRKPALIDSPLSPRRMFVATDRAVYLGTLHLPLRGMLQALKPGQGGWCRLEIQGP